MKDSDEDKTKPVRFTLDGRPLVSQGNRLLAGALLRRGGLNPAGYDLAQVRPGQGQPKRYGDDDDVHLKAGDAFVSIRQSAPVA